MKDASEYDANLPRGDALWKLVAGEKEVKNEAGEVTSPAKEPTLRAKKSERAVVPTATYATPYHTIDTQQPFCQWIRVESEQRGMGCSRTEWNGLLLKEQARAHERA